MKKVSSTKSFFVYLSMSIHLLHSAMLKIYSSKGLLLRILYYLIALHLKENISMIFICYSGSHTNDTVKLNDKHDTCLIHRILVFFL